MLCTLFIVSAAQLILSLALMRKAKNTNENLNKLPKEKWIIIHRFILGVTVHMFIVSKISSGFKNIKYLLNHPWKFDQKLFALAIGYQQVAVFITIEICSFFIVMTSSSFQQIATSLLIMIAISQLDDLCYRFLPEAQYKLILESKKFL